MISALVTGPSIAPSQELPRPGSLSPPVLGHTLSSALKSSSGSLVTALIKCSSAHSLSLEMSQSNLPLTLFCQCPRVPAKACHRQDISLSRIFSLYKFSISPLSSKPTEGRSWACLLVANHTCKCLKTGKEQSGRGVHGCKLDTCTFPTDKVSGFRNVFGFSSMAISFST